MSLQREWKKRTNYSIQSGQWIICRTLSPEQYTLWRGTERIGTYPTADQAKAAAVVD